MTLYLVIGLGVLSFMMLLLGMRGQKKAAPEFEDRLNTFASRAGMDVLNEESEGFYKRILRPGIKRLSTKLGQRTPGASLDRVRTKIAQAGNPSGLGPMEFLGLRY